jgi:hypothetical protein
MKRQTHFTLGLESEKDEGPTIFSTLKLISKKLAESDIQFQQYEEASWQEWVDKMWGTAGKK